MRYLIAETNWTTTTLAHALSQAGVLLTRTDRPEDLPQFIAQSGADLVVISADAFHQTPFSLRELCSDCDDIPVALLTDAGAQAQAVSYLEAGADALISHHEPIDQMTIHLHALARRRHGLGSSDLRYGPLHLDLLNRAAYLMDRPLKLGPKLYEVLEYLALRPGKIVTRPDLLDHIYGLEDEPDPRVFDVYICNLRAALRDARRMIDIQTKRGTGFRFVAAGASQIAA